MKENQIPVFALTTNTVKKPLFKLSLVGLNKDTKELFDTFLKSKTNNKISIPNEEDRIEVEHPYYAEFKGLNYDILVVYKWIETSTIDECHETLH